MDPTLIISPLNPDPDQIMDQLTQDLGRTDSWNNLADSGTGRTLIRWLGTLGGFFQFGIERSLQETLPDTLRIPSSQVRINRMLGVHTSRRRPGAMEVSILRLLPQVSEVIPAFTQWVCNGEPFYNREPITFGANVETGTAIIWQGTVTRTMVNSDGSDYQRFLIGTIAGEVSDEDLWAEIDTDTWHSTRDGLWSKTSRDRVFWERTLPNNQVELIFGNGIYGALPRSGSFNIGYVQCSSAADSATPIEVGTVVLVTDFPDLVVQTTGPRAPNEDPRSTDFYKIMSSKMYATKDRVVNRDDHRARAVQYPGVIDAIFRGQRELNPADLRYSMIVSATLITTAPWTEIQWKAFVVYMSKQLITNVVLIRRDPDIVPISLVADLAVFSRANLEDAKHMAEACIQQFFAAQLGSLGALYHLSDLNLALIRSVKDSAGTLIDYLDLDPNESISLPSTSYAELKTLQVNIRYTERNPSSTAIGRPSGL